MYDLDDQVRALDDWAQVGAAVRDLRSRIGDAERLASWLRGLRVTAELEHPAMAAVTASLLSAIDELGAAARDAAARLRADLGEV
jgi:hypothetical protein